MVRKWFALFCALLWAMACGNQEGGQAVADGVGADLRVVEGRQASTAGDHGLHLMLPFGAGEVRVLTQAYWRPERDNDPEWSHRTGGAVEFDDRFALDIAGTGCGNTWGTPVMAAESGVVVDYPLPGSRASKSRLDVGYGGSQVFIDHGNGCYSHYGHLESRSVSPGQRVRQGEQIGVVGNEGNVIAYCGSEQVRGAHVHFKVVCDGEAVIPEPISGFTYLEDHEGDRLTHHSLQHPVGTLVKAAGQPEIFLVCAPGTLCHVRNEEVWRSYRFWQDPSSEWATVVTVDADELACHDRGLDLDRPVALDATTCLSDPGDRSGTQSGDAWQTYVTFDDGATRWRKRVPFAEDKPEYAILLKSWGFRTADVTRNGRSCAVPSSRQSLPLRDGSVIEAADDNDFYVVSNGGMAYRLYRNLMPVLYGHGWPQVMQVPSGSVASLVTGMEHGHNAFTVTDATTCHNGSRTLEPSSSGDGKGGGERDGEGIGDEAPDEFVPAPAAGEAPPAPEPPAETPPVEGEPPTEVAEAAPPSQDDPSGTICCAASNAALHVTVTGLAPESLMQPGGLAEADIGFVGAGGDGGLSWSPSADAAPSAPYEGAGTPVSLALPDGVTRFNLWVWDAAEGQAHWLDLRQFTAAGECHIADDGFGGLVLLR